MIVRMKLKDMTNKTKFFDSIRKSIFVKLSQSQVDGMNFILDECKAACISDMRWVAYMLATAYHETAATMQPIREYNRGKGYDYGKKLKMSRVPYTSPDRIYYGRGYVQLTWYENYQLMSRLIGVDLLNNPDLALDKKIAARIMIEGMTKGSSSFGDFTGKCLEMYFNDTLTDWNNARRIINGTDKAELIAGYAKKFYSALTSD